MSVAPSQNGFIGPEKFSTAFHRPMPWIDAALSNAEIAPGVYDREGMHPTVEAELDRQLARGPHAFAPECPAVPDMGEGA